MFRDALFLARKDLQRYFRHPQVWLWAFVGPIVFSYLIGSLMPFANTSRPEPIALSTGPDAGFLADELARRLDASGYQVARIGGEVRPEQYRLRLVIPAGFTASVLAGTPAEIEMVCDGAGLWNDYHRYRLSRITNGILGDLVLLSKQGRAPTAEAFAQLASQPRKLVLEVESAGHPRQAILGFQQSVPGFIVMFTLLVSLNAGGIFLVTERRQGILRRLAATPISRASIVAGKLASRVALGMIQVGFAMLTGKWLFGVYWGGPSLWAVLLLLGAYTTLCAALALAAGILARTEGQSLAIGIVAANLLGALGGCWWPIEVTPPWMQRFALLLPTGWAMDALHKLLSYGATPASVLPHFAALVISALLVSAAAARGFRFS